MDEWCVRGACVVRKQAHLVDVLHDVVQRAQQLLDHRLHARLVRVRIRIGVRLRIGVRVGLRLGLGLGLGLGSGLGSGFDGLRARVLARAAGAGQSPLALARALEDGVDADTVGLVQ